MATTVRARASWAWWGVAGGVLGLVANLGADAQSALPETARPLGPDVVTQLSPSTYHVGAAAGLAACACLVLVAAAWRRWATERPTPSLALDAIAPAILVSAAALLVAYGLRGGLAEYLPGGINDDNFTDAGLYVLFMFDDTAPWLGWWGVIMAAGLTAWASFRLRLVPRWLGAVSALALVLPVGLMATSGAVAIAGLLGPVWLAASSLVVALHGLPVIPARHPAPEVTQGFAH